MVVSKYIISSITLLAYVFVFSNCVHKTESANSGSKARNPDPLSVASDSLRIAELLQEVLDWSSSDSAIVVIPVFTKDGIYHFDMMEVEKNLNKLQSTGFFTSGFTLNYNKIMLTLDQKLTKNELGQWLVGDLPPFKFANDVDPWCMCQGYSREQFGGIETITKDSSSGSFYWKWKSGNDWADFKFETVKEKGQWKIASMEGFDYLEAIKRSE